MHRLLLTENVATTKSEKENAAMPIRATHSLLIFSPEAEADEDMDEEDLERERHFNEMNAAVAEAIRKYDLENPD